LVKTHQSTACRRWAAENSTMIALPTQVLPADEVDAAAGAGSWLSVISLAAPNSFYQILENARVYLWASAPGVLADESSLRIKCGAPPLAPDDTRTAVRQATAGDTDQLFT
jgi:hypothetical protein